MDKIKLKGFIYAALSAALYGLIPYFSKTLQLDGYGDDIILTYRYVIAALVYVAYVVVRRVAVKISFAAMAEVVVIGLTCMAPTAFLFLLSFNYIPTGISTAISFLYPVVVAVLMAVFYKQKLVLSVKAGIFLSVAGVALLSWMPGKIQFMGVLYTLLSAVTYGAYFVALNRPRMKAMSPQVLTFYWMVLGSVCFLSVSAMSGRLEWITSPKFLFNTGMLAIFSTIFASIFLIRAIDTIGSVLASVLGTFEPLTAMLIGVLHFGEHTEISTYAGFLLVLAAVGMVVYGNQKKAGR